MMPISVARLEAGAIARFQNFLTRIGDQHHFAFQHKTNSSCSVCQVALADHTPGLSRSRLMPNWVRPAASPNLRRSRARQGWS